MKMATKTHRGGRAAAAGQKIALIKKTTLDLYSALPNRRAFVLSPHIKGSQKSAQSNEGASGAFLMCGRPHLNNSG